MIKPLNVPQLSSAKPRAGLQKISDLLPRLIRQYELQAEMLKRREQAEQNAEAQPIAPAVEMGCEQATFSWYE